MLPRKLAGVNFVNMSYLAPLLRGWIEEMGDLYSFFLPITPVLLWVRAPERAHNFQSYPRGCLSPNRPLRTALQLSERTQRSAFLIGDSPPAG